MATEFKEIESRLWKVADTLRADSTLLRLLRAFEELHTAIAGDAIGHIDEYFLGGFNLRPAQYLNSHHFLY